MTTNFTITVNEEGKSVAVFVANGLVANVTEEHPNYARIVDALRSGENPEPLLNPATFLRILSERVTILPGEHNDTILFDGEEIDNRLSATILRYDKEGRDPSNLVSFMERLQRNPSARSRKQLFDWVEQAGLTVDEEGFIVAWKGVREEQERDEEGALIGTTLTSVSQGTAWVDGVRHEGFIPNYVGAVVTMPRSEVDDDYGIPCSTGLHIGSFDYAKGFGQRVLEVRIDPADVVSVPRHDTNKMRCCRYEVLAVQPKPSPNLSGYEPERGQDDDLSDVLEYLQHNVPETFVDRLKARLGIEDEDDDGFDDYEDDPEEDF